MRILLSLVGFLLVAAVALAAFARLAPVVPGDWHVAPDIPGEGEAVLDAAGDYRIALLRPESPAALLERIDAIALATPRTKRLLGSPGEGMITYVTRSQVFGFPDYTTVQAVPVQGGTRLLIHARLRFGQSDLGVNKARVESWLQALGKG